MGDGNMAVIYWACNVNGKRLGRINTVSYEKLRISFEDTGIIVHSMVRS